MPVAPDRNDEQGQTIGQQEQEAAFMAMLNRYVLLHLGRLPDGMEIIPQATMRFAFAAGVRYGLSLRGCCEEEKP